MRRFLNENLSEIPEPWRADLCARLRQDQTQATWFELVTGRFLQLRGAKSLVGHPDTRSGRRVDWRAEFDDGPVSLEASVPVFDAAVGTQMRDDARLLDLMGTLVPPGWTALPSALPRLDGAASLGPYRRLVEAMFSGLPDPSTLPGQILHLQGALSEGPLEVGLYAKATGEPIGMEPGGAYFPDAEQRIAAAWNDKRKRAQGRAAEPPPILALMGAGFGVRLHHFQNALFGAFMTSGVMVSDMSPPWAGVLAFIDLGYRRGADPVFFASPHWPSELPERLEG